MTREEIVEQIAKELLDNDVLDSHNYSNDVQSLLDETQSIILANLKDYVLIKGTVLE